jgi:predicted acetyltransferase
VVVLSPPDVRFQRSYLEALDELTRAGEDQYGVAALAIPPDERYAGELFTRRGLEDPAEFARYVRWCRDDSLPERPRPTGWVPATHWWMSTGTGSTVYLGRISLRHQLTPFLLDEGGHVGYTVRPGARGHGHAADALRQVVGLAGRDHGIDRVLVTCDEDNAASARTIEKGGGRFEDVRRGKRRYWIDSRTAAPPPRSA